MADEELDVQEDAEAVVAAEEVSEPVTVEALASELGWKPKEEWQGDESLWQPADQFLRAPRERRDNHARELRAMRDQLDRLTSASSQVLADKLAERDAHWQAQLEKAVEDGNHVEAKKAVAELTKIEAEKKTEDKGLPAEARDFMERHKAWFGVDPLATSRAKALADQLAKDGLNHADQLTQVERAIRKEFPELFPAPAKTPPATQTAQTRAATTGSRKKGYADMPAESRKLADEYKTQHGVPVEKFAESYWADQERRMVG